MSVVVTGAPPQASAEAASAENLAGVLLSHLEAGDTAAAITASRVLLALRPDDAQTLCLHAIVARRNQPLAPALRLLDRASRTAPDDEGIRRNRDALLTNALSQAEVFAGQADPLMAKTICDTILTAFPGHAPALEARRALVEPLLSKAIEHHTVSRYGEAATVYRAILDIDPTHPDALHLLGRAERWLGNPLRGAELVVAALDTGQASPQAEESLRLCLSDSYGLLNTHYATQRFAEMLALTTRLADVCGERLPMADRKTLAAMLHNASFPLQDDHCQTDLALALSEAAFALQPALPIYVRLLLLRLAKRDYARAWDPRSWATLVCPLTPRTWDGSSDCRSLLIVNTNGLGDFLQFLRFVPEAVKRVERVTLQVRPDVLPLVTGSPLLSGVRLVAPDEPVTAERECELFSLPNAMGLDPFKVPMPDPMLPLPAGLAEDWRRVVRRSDTLHVGLVWSSGGEKDRRSVGLAPFLPLMADSDAVFIGLQNNIAKDELLRATPPANFVDFGIQGLENLAAIIRSLDLVVTTDCGLSHLACALGVETWVLVHHGCDWRWHMEGDRCDWYPRARVFRQSKERDWTPALRQLGEALAHRLSVRPGGDAL